MRRLFPGLLIVLCSFVCFASEKTELQTAVQPKIEFSELDYDFGENLAGPPLVHTFKFKNTGDAPLFIEKVKAG